MAERLVELADVRPGQIWWAEPDPAVGREQAGRRPLLIVSNDKYHELMTTLVLAVPLTSRGRGWPNHISVSTPTLGQASFAMTEQVRVVSRGRLVSLLDTVSATTLRSVREWIGEYMHE